LRAQVAGLQNELAARKEAEDGAAAERAEATPTDARSVAEQREEADRQWREHMTQVAASFDSEPANPAWSQATQGAVEAAIQRDPVLRERAGDITCKSHTCRMTVTRDPGGSVDKQMPVFAQSLGGVLPSVQADNTVVDGQPQYTLYLSDVRPVAANRAAN